MLTWMKQSGRRSARAIARASASNLGLFFGEDVFIAIGSILLIKGFFKTQGIVLQPFDLSVWAIPSAGLALLIHGGRLLWRDRRQRNQPQ